MVELLIIACLMQHPDQCQEFRVPFFEPTHLMECLFKAQVFMGRWSEEHPGWLVRRWSCAAPRA